jgi:hypothetical protein
MRMILLCHIPLHPHPAAEATMTTMTMTTNFCHILQQFCLNFVTRVCQFVIFFLSKTWAQKSNTLLQTCSM